MDADKLNEAADKWTHFYNTEMRTEPLPYNGRFKKGFIKGAQWLMQQPLADRLTNEEKEKIRESYNKAQKDTYDNTIEGAIKCTVSAVVMNCLIGIFGKELFNQPTEV